MSPPFRLLRHIANATTVINITSMTLAAIGSDWAWFTVGLASAGLSGYARIYFREAEDEMSKTWLGYRDVATRLRWEIKEEGYQPGQQLPSGRELADRLNTNRTTVRRALELLETEGVIMTIASKGSFVLDPAGHPTVLHAGRSGQIEQHIRRQIRAGYTVASTESLAVAFSVSPSTARRVVAKLIDEGVIRRARGGQFEARR